MTPDRPAARAQTLITRDGRTLHPRQAFFADPAARAAYAALMEAVFEIDVEAHDRLCGRDPTCRPFALFDPAGLCVASAEVFVLPLIAAGTPFEAAAIRLVAVHPAWRGLGLFRAVMEPALAWSDAAIDGPALLYAADAALYERFGFEAVAQHKVVGPAPAASAGIPAVRFSLADAEHLSLTRRLLATRVPVSDGIAVRDGGALFLANAAADPGIDLDYLTDLDALVAIRRNARGALTLVDVVAPSIPPLRAILGGLGGAPRSVEVLFAADRLDWSGAIREDETGLMIRGAGPPAFSRPFMLPPTAGF